LCVEFPLVAPRYDFAQAQVRRFRSENVRFLPMPSITGRHW